MPKYGAGAGAGARVSYQMQGEHALEEQDTWWGCTFSQNLSSLALMVWEGQCFEDIFTKDNSVTELIMKLVVEQPGLQRVS